MRDVDMHCAFIVGCVNTSTLKGDANVTICDLGVNVRRADVTMKCLEVCIGEYISKEAFICILALCYVYVKLHLLVLSCLSV